MLYKIDYITRNEPSKSTRFVNFAADKTEAVKRFMEWFFRSTPYDAVKIELLTEIEFTGDMSGLEFIDAAIAREEEKGR